MVKNEPPISKGWNILSCFVRLNTFIGRNGGSEYSDLAVPVKISIGHACSFHLPFHWFSQTLPNRSFPVRTHTRGALTLKGRLPDGAFHEQRNQ